MHDFEFSDQLDPTLFRRQLKRWYDRNARTLPWRETANPYHIWISEIMLQQTTVKAVVPYFERFLRRFPDVAALARSSEAEVLQLWEGLGYYSRGRNLRRAAQLIVNDHAGRFPHSLQELQKLPGVGRYTAGAIRSFAFNQPAPILEANTLRLYARITGYTDDPRSTAGQRHLWAFAEFLQPTRTAGTLNQALMELGSLICTPQTPNCTLCPVKSHCRAFAEGTQQRIPQKKPRPETTPLVDGTVAVRRGDKYVLRQYTTEERWTGLWDFPRFPLQLKDPAQTLTKQLHTRLASQTATLLSDAVRRSMGPLTFEKLIKHSVTRYRIRLLCYSVEIEDLSPDSLPEGWRVFEWSEIAELPMPVSGRKFAKHLLDR